MIAGRRLLSNMRRILLAIASFAVALPLSSAEIRCRVLNGTTGGEASPESAVLYKLGQGMDEVASLSNPGPTLAFRDLSTEDQFLLQINYKGIKYNSQLAFDRGEMISREVTVYEVGQDDSGIRLSIPHLVVGAQADSLTVNITVDVTNDGKHVYAVPGLGGFRFALPEGFGRVESASATTTEMPTPQEVVSLGQPGLFAVDYPIKPGRTQVNLMFQTSYSGSFSFKQRWLYPVTEHHVFLMPSTLAIQSASLKLHAEPTQGFSEYDGGAVEKEGLIEFAISGEGIAEGAGMPDDATHGAGDDGVDVIARPPALFRYRNQLIALMVLVVSVGFWFGLREKAGEPVAPREAPKKKSRR